MKKYKTVFSAFHTIYRLVTTSADVTNFLSGVCRVYRGAFRSDKVVMVCKNLNGQGFIKIRLEDKTHYIKKGGVSILTHRERDILTQEKEIFLDNRLVYPFIFSDTMGAVYIKRKERGAIFNEFERRWFLSICEEVSIGLKIFALYREARRAMINYVKSFTKLLDQYVPTSHLHTKSVFRLIKVVGKEMKLSESEIKSLEYASLLHDAGKIQLPSKILKKQKPLTDEEYKLVMKHPRKGVELIKDLELLKPAIPIILHHHERYDGKGYPGKLKKDGIPLGSRILAVLDAFDAMFFGRPYRKRRYLEAIESEFRSKAGNQFDPQVVEALLKVLRRKGIRKYLQSFL
ncbi:MAG: HD domain-containing phosphohydrolase [Candidatus Omnitrophota bacterium]|nr:HD domain-containing protein [Candidatus Omnitrophota bacterium]